MTFKHALAPLFLFATLALPAAAADPTVTLTGVHLCCDNCVRGVTTALNSVKGASATCDKSASTIVLTASSKETLQSAVNALTSAGYYGKSSDDGIKVNADTNAPDGKVKTLEVSGIHLCCNSCVTAMKGVVAKVDGIKSDTIKSRATSITLTGDFDPKAFFTELQKAGLTGKVAAAPANTK